MACFSNGGCMFAVLSLLLNMMIQEGQSLSFQHFCISSTRACGVAGSRRPPSAMISTMSSCTTTMGKNAVQSPTFAAAFSRFSGGIRGRHSTLALASSFYGKFEEDSDEEDEDEDDDDDDEDDEEDDYLDLDDNSLAAFRSKMSNLYDDNDDDDNKDSSGGRSASASSIDALINYARSQSSDKDEPKDWARPVTDQDKMVQKGIVLLANPAKFCNDFDERNSRPNPALLAKFGLTLPPPADLGPDRRADLLPVLVIVEHDESNDGKQQLRLPSFLSRGGSETRGVLLNRRTGYLLGDLEPPPSSSNEPSAAAAPGMLEKFCIQPLWFGGVDNLSTGLDMLHLCPNVPDAVQLTDDGLWWGGDPGTAQDCMSDPSLDRVYTGFDFKFFAQSTVWAPGDLAKQIASDTWFCAHVSKEVLFKSRDRMGTQRAKPLWTEIMELMGGPYQDVRDKLYKNL